MPLKAVKNSDRSASRSKPTIRLRTESADRGAAAGDPRREPGRPHEHPQRATLDELGQPPRRVEEVERVAGRRRVEDEQVEAALGVQLEQLLHRHVLLRAGEGVGDLLVDAVRRGPGRATPRRARGGATSSSKVAFASSIIAHSSPSISIPWRSNSAGSTRLRLVAELLQARASRRAASPGRSSARRPSGPARPSRSRSPPRWSSCRRRPSRRRCRSPCRSRISSTVAHQSSLSASRRAASTPQLGLEDEGQRLDRRARRGAAGGRAGRAASGPGGARRARPGPRAPAPSSRSRRASARRSASSSEKRSG